MIMTMIIGIVITDHDRVIVINIVIIIIISRPSSSTPFLNYYFLYKLKYDTTVKAVLYYL